MKRIVVTAFWYLAFFDAFVALHDFVSLYEKVRNCEGKRSPSPHATVSQICSAVDRAIIWYPKQILCLQRSTAIVWLLRRSGFDARLVLGVRQRPFKAHAWVEVEGQVINDKPSVAQTFAVLDRC